MEVSVQIRGRLDSVKLRMQPSDSVFTLKSEIHRVADVPIAVQLISNPQTLLEADRYSLSHYGVQPDATLNVDVHPELAELQQFFIETATIPRFEVGMRRYDSIAALKETVETLQSLPKSQLRVFFMGEEMNDEHNFAYYNASGIFQALLPGNILIAIEGEHSSSNFLVITPTMFLRDVLEAALGKLGRCHSYTYRLVLDSTPLDVEKRVCDYPIEHNSRLLVDRTEHVMVYRNCHLYYYPEVYYFDSVSSVKETACRNFSSQSVSSQLYCELEALPDTQRIGLVANQTSRYFYLLYPGEVIISVATLSSSSTYIIVGVTETIGEILSHPELSNYETKQLVYMGNVMESHRKLSDYGITAPVQLASNVKIAIEDANGKAVNCPFIRLPGMIQDVMQQISIANHIPVLDQRLFWHYVSELLRALSPNTSLDNSYFRLVLLLPSDVYLTITSGDQRQIVTCAASTDTVKSVKRRIEKIRHTPMKRISLYVGETRMENKRTLRSYGLNFEANLTLLDSEETLVTLKISDGSKKPFLIRGNITIKETEKQIKELDIWFKYHSCELLLQWKGRELLPTENTSKIGIKTGDIIEVSVRDEVCISLKTGFQETINVMFRSTDTVVDVKSRIYSRSSQGDRDTLFLNREKLREEVKLGDLNLGKKCEMEYQCVNEKMIVCLKTTDHEVVNVGIQEYYAVVANLLAQLRYRRRSLMGKLLYKGKQVEKGKELKSLDLVMWSELDLVLPGSFLLWVKPTSYKSFLIGINPNEKTTVIKRKIAEMIPISESEQRLLYASKSILEEEKSVLECGIRNGNTVELICAGDVCIDINCQFGKKFRKVMPKTATIRQLSVAIEKKSGLLCTAQILRYRGKELTQTTLVGDVEEGADFALDLLLHQ